jgi:hypothetical protein
MVLYPHYIHEVRKMQGFLTERGGVFLFFGKKPPASLDIIGIIIEDKQIYSNSRETAAG